MILDWLVWINRNECLYFSAKATEVGSTPTSTTRFSFYRVAAFQHGHVLFEPSAVDFSNQITTCCVGRTMVPFPSVAVNLWAVSFCFAILQVVAFFLFIVPCI